MPAVEFCGGELAALIVVVEQPAVALAGVVGAVEQPFSLVCFGGLVGVLGEQFG
ncbi:MAG: hypothetical protein VB080_08845 [Propionicimonas sp.]|uniref:hypothetical protein n=1 Tax=Propionicimonas sp. TaxID=1955623 RepID=UPI002B205C65|nr:hypothetical protein [Propionicimonas sp.]MEA4944529.1 hypothetical protein [Propionicimonas sp.]